LRIVEGDTDIGDGQRRQRVGRREVAVQRGDQQHRAAIGPQVAHQLEQRRTRRVTHGDAGGQILGAGDVAQHHPGAGAVRGLQQRDGERVDLPAHVDAADAFAVHHEVGVFKPLGGRRRRFLRPHPAQAGPGGRQLVGIGLGGLLPVQQRVGHLVDPVLVPAGQVSPGNQHGTVVTAQRRPVDHDDLHPVQAAQSAGVED
jgi:hypothetical protein